MSQVIDLCKAELNKDYIVHKIKNNNKVYENYFWPWLTLTEEQWPYSVL